MKLHPKMRAGMKPLYKFPVAAIRAKQLAELVRAALEVADRDFNAALDYRYMNAACGYSDQQECRLRFKRLIDACEAFIDEVDCPKEMK